MKMQEGVRFFPIFWNRPEPGKRKRMFRCSAEEGNVFPGMELNFRVDIFGFGATLSSGKENGGDAMNLAELMRFGERKSGAVICLEPLHCAFVGTLRSNSHRISFSIMGRSAAITRPIRGWGSARATRREASKSPGGRDSSTFCAITASICRTGWSPPVTMRES